MLLYLAIAYVFFYITNAHGIIMDFTLNTIMGDQDGHEYVNLVMRSCFFVTRANSKRLSLGWSNQRATKVGDIREDLSNASVHRQQGDEGVCVVSFQRKASNRRGNKVLGSGLVTMLDPRDSIVICKEHQKKCKNKSCGDIEDDETASTVDMDEDEFPVSALSSKRNTSQRTVHFDKNLVTAVYTRPRTTKDDKYYLYYDEYDYMDFKMEYRDDLLQQQQQSTGNGQPRSLNYRRSPRKVSFKREVVDSVHPVMDRAQRMKIQSKLFYTEEEMRTFLDEFVESLQKQSIQREALPSS